MLKRFIAACAFVTVSAVAPVCAQTTDAGQRRVVEVAFVLDTTGSMGPLIEGAKRTIWQIATTILGENPEALVRMALVAYRDIGDEYVTRRFDMTRDIQSLYGEMLALRAQGGGDWPESVNEALDVAVTRLDWTPGAHVDRIVFLVGDAPPHMDYAQDRKYPDVLAEARRRGIVVNAVQAGTARDTERAWRHIASLGGGRYIAIPQDGGRVAADPTPFDNDILELQRRINRTVVPYGRPEQQRSVQERTAQVERAPAASAGDMASFINRADRGRNAITGEGDLVTDVLRGGRRLEDVPDADLPEDMRRMSASERRAHLERLDGERQALAARMAVLVAERDRHQAERRAQIAADRTRAALPARPGEPPRPVAPPAPAFDEAVRETLQQQLRR